MTRSWQQFFEKIFVMEFRNLTVFLGLQFNKDNCDLTQLTVVLDIDDNFVMLDRTHIMLLYFSIP